MVDIGQLVEAKLKEANSPEAIGLWQEVWKRYEEAGPDAVQDDLLAMLRQVKSAAAKEIKETKEVVPRKSTRRRRRR